MAELKTKATQASVARFLEAINDEKLRRDCETLAGMLRQATKAEPVMWGAGIVGFGSLHYKYASGREGDWFVAGFAPRKQNLTVYLMGGFQAYPELMEKLGKHKTGKGCLYIKSLDDVHLPTLRKLIQKSVKDAPRLYAP